MDLTSAALEYLFRMYAYHYHSRGVHPVYSSGCKLLKGLYDLELMEERYYPSTCPEGKVADITDEGIRLVEMQYYVEFINYLADKELWGVTCLVIKRLTTEQLPACLSHKYKEVRTYAKERFETSGGTTQCNQS